MVPFTTVGKFVLAPGHTIQVIINFDMHILCDIVRDKVYGFAQCDIVWCITRQDCAWQSYAYIIP